MIGRNSTAKIAANDISVQFFCHKPIEDMAYVGFLIKIPHNMDTALRYGKDNFHSFEVRV